MNPPAPRILRPAPLLAAVLLTALLAGCSDDSQSRHASRTTGPTTSSAPREEPPPAPEYGYTYTSAAGDRAVEGTANLPASEPVDVELSGVPAWVAGVPTEDGTVWVAVLEDGTAEAFRVGASGEPEPARIEPDRLPPGAPPLLRSRDGKLELVEARDEASDLTHPVPLDPAGDGRLMVVGPDGELRVESGGETAPVPEAPPALPDARLVRAPSGDLATLTGPTDRYEHGVLGDGLEAETITVLRPTPDGAEVRESFEAASGGVFEGLAPTYFERGDKELLAVTESLAGRGTRVSVYAPGGGLVAAGPFIGEGMKWRHLTSVAPFAPDGEPGISATRTPHMDAAAEFYEFDEESGLEAAARVPGYTSHRIYSRNLDAALAGDLDADGRTELLAPDPSYTVLGGLERTREGAGDEWSLPLGGVLSTNLAAASGPDSGVVAAGRSDGVLRIWR